MAIAYRSVLASGGMEIDSISITTPPTKTSYFVGDTIDTTGMVVTATAGLLSGNVASECTVSPQTFNTAGTQTVTVSYGGKTDTFNVTVTAEAISITTQPTKRAYIVGDTLDLTGIVVTSNKSGNVTSSCTFSPANGSTLSTAGTITVTATYNGLTTTTTVTATAISGISITTPPTKTSYNVNEYLDLTGIVVTATAGSLTRDVTASCTFSPANGTQLTTGGTFNITATYGSFTATTQYTVVAITIKPFATATDAEIADMLQHHYAGDINLYEDAGWAVGSERSVSLSAMAATGVGESHVAQTVTFVIMNHGGKTLNTAVSGKTTCAFIVGQKNMLASNGTREGGYMNSSNVNSGGWDSCARRTWCNSVYKNALPSTFAALFKQVHNYTGQGSTSQSTAVDSVDYFALPSEKEVFGSTTYADATAETNNTQFKYYETAANRIKYPGDGTGLSATGWWGRSPYGTNATYFCYVDAGGYADTNAASATRGLAPFGCI